MVCGVSTFVDLHFLSDSITKLASFHVFMEFIYIESDTNIQIYISGLKEFLFLNTSMKPFFLFQFLMFLILGRREGVHIFAANT